KASNKIAINGTANLPEQLRSLGQSPAAFQITGSFPDLQSLTAQFPEPLSGAANLTGQLEIKDAVLHLGARINSESITFSRGTLAEFQADITASKKMP